MANLAIKGHSTRGNEVIEILEMLGGNNKYHINITECNLLYTIREGDDAIIATYPNSNISKIYTLEEFDKKFPYKVGDKVSSKYLKNYKIVKMEWKDTNNRVIYKLQGMGWYNSDELEKCKEETMEENRDEPKAPILYNRYDYAEGKCGYVIPNGYEFDSIKQGFQTEIILRPIKSQYPKTYEECCENVFGIVHGGITVDLPMHYSPLFIHFAKLLICRDAYWKIAGDWKPNWKDFSTQKYSISVNKDDIILSQRVTGNRIFVFPTEEMRDAFYNNFKDLIEQCKDLL